MGRAWGVRVALLLALSGCVHAPNLHIEKVKVDAVTADSITYCVEVKNVARHSLFSRCRTAPARDRISIRGTLSSSQTPGTIAVGGALLVDPTGDGIRTELRSGHHDDASVAIELDSSPPQPGYLVVELVSNGTPAPCARIGDRKAVPLPKPDSAD